MFGIKRNRKTVVQPQERTVPASAHVPAHVKYAEAEKSWESFNQNLDLFCHRLEALGDLPANSEMSDERRTEIEQDPRYQRFASYLAKAYERDNV